MIQQERIVERKEDEGAKKKIVETVSNWYHVNFGIPKERNYEMEYIHCQKNLLQCIRVINIYSKLAN